VGYGGSCFPKDVKALAKIAKENGYEAQLISAVEAVNDAQKIVVAQKIVNRFGEDLTGKTFGVWGLSYKPETDDMREAPAIYVIKNLVQKGAKIKVYDPKAMTEAKQHYLKGVENITYCNSKYEVLENSNALLLLTEWKEFRSPDFEQIKAQLVTSIIFDGRNQYIAYDLEAKGIEYHRIGK
jgi:UDPglucose 6-dehydrogenase